jgi:hypothetical protein
MPSKRLPFKGTVEREIHSNNFGPPLNQWPSVTNEVSISFLLCSKKCLNSTGEAHAQRMQNVQTPMEVNIGNF